MASSTVASHDGEKPKDARKEASSLVASGGVNSHVLVLRLARKATGRVFARSPIYRSSAERSSSSSWREFSAATLISVASRHAEAAHASCFGDPETTTAWWHWWAAAARAVQSRDVRSQTAATMRATRAISCSEAADKGLLWRSVFSHLRRPTTQYLYNICTLPKY